jgi:hypothetical protein
MRLAASGADDGPAEACDDFGVLPADLRARSLDFDMVFCFCAERCGMAMKI